MDEKEKHMIPDRIVEVIHGPAVMYVGTRDESSTPLKHM